MRKIQNLKSLLGVSTIAVLAGIIATVVPIVQQFIGTYKVAIASSPAKAELKLNGKHIGTSPLTINLKVGTYNIEASKGGYETMEHIIKVSSNETNIVNLQLLPYIKQPIVDKSNDVHDRDINIIDVLKIENEVKNLKALLISNPEESATIPILNERVRLQGEEIRAVREDLKSVKELGKWYLGSTIGIVVSLMGVIATLFIANKGK